ncbi:hypothetical protein A2U01_0003686, partial [Trifolium medium]|nr:hypothetical protein [Trifolium medium]
HEPVQENSGESGRNLKPVQDLHEPVQSFSGKLESVQAWLEPVHGLTLKDPNKS